MLDIPEGAYGRTRAGEKVGPVTRRKCDTYTDKAGFYYVTPQQPLGYYSHGRLIDDGSEAPRDLVAIWQDGPVVTETVTKTRIVPGVYGILRVSLQDSVNYPVIISLAGRATGRTIDEMGVSADELDAAAAVLSALAKGLRDA